MQMSTLSLPIKGGHFERPPSAFRSSISRSADARFRPEKDRYVLYINLGCPWAHRTNIVHQLKGLDAIIQRVLLDPQGGPEGWHYTGRFGTAAQDPVYGFQTLKQLYLKADLSYAGRITVPVLWDKKHETIVNNESSEIIRMFFTEFDDLLPPRLRESQHAATAGRGFYPPSLRAEIDAMNDWVYPSINNGVYRAGFATTQEAYEEAVYPLFDALDRVEAHLARPGHSPYLFGEQITEADIRLYTTVARFDVGYYLLFKCNLKMIRHDYPNIHNWYLRLYWDSSDKTNGGAFRRTTDFRSMKLGYMQAKGSEIFPVGPSPDIPELPAQKI
ncbi:hypothetical protein CNMCM5623_001663 [Aspergillus felis]|uniref:GST C-terminal domain-containing protein n=1 Tax=Aspergillus felis TaxID=1287682 RepID=A0A8H6UZT0_9EURO|nr:hypothetical protein CNMCM5623_001663 [Aspergillus felis]